MYEVGTDIRQKHGGVRKSSKCDSILKFKYSFSFPRFINYEVFYDVCEILFSFKLNFSGTKVRISSIHIKHV